MHMSKSKMVQNSGTPAAMHTHSPHELWLEGSFTGGVRIPFTDVIRTTLISILIPAQMQRPEVVRGPDEFLSEFSLPQGNPTQPGRKLRYVRSLRESEGDERWEGYTVRQ